MMSLATAVSDNAVYQDQIFKAGKVATIKIACSDAVGGACAITAECNLSVFTSNGSTLLNKVVMTANGDGTYSYGLTPSQTNGIGNYDLSAYCEDGASRGIQTGKFIITPSGEEGNLVTLVFLLVVILFFLGLGFYLTDAWMVMIPSMAMFILGLYTLINGVDIYRNITTSAISVIIIFTGAYIAIKAGIEVIQDNL